jgi:hypothetical protein
VAPERTNLAVGQGGALVAPAASDQGEAGKESAAVNAALARVRAATARYHDVAAAVADGYVLDSACVASPAGAMGVHAVNQQRILTPGVTAEEPEALLYEPRPDGGYRLVGVEYLEVVIVRTPTGTGPWLPAAQWPQNDPGYAILNQRPTLFGQPFNGEMAGHSPTMPWHWDLHVWIWQPNPAGTFAQFNPAVSCG